MPRIGTGGNAPDGERTVEGRLSSSLFHPSVATCRLFSLFYPCHPCDPWWLCLMFLVAANEAALG